MMKAQRYIPSFLCVLLWLLACVCVRAERLPVRIYTSADGLGSSFVSNLMRDSHGFLWVCTRDGLSRFDGSHFVTYRISDKNAPPGIEQILETSRGIYWIVTTGGLYRFNPDAPATNNNASTDHPTLDAELMSEQRGVLYEDAHGNLWSGGDGLYRLEEKDGKVFPRKVELNLPANPSNAFIIAAMREGQDGSLWLVTSWGLVRRLPDGREIFYSGSANTDASISVLADREGRIWLGRTSGVYIIKPEPLNEIAHLGSLTVRELDRLAKVQTHNESHISLPESSGEIYKYTGLGSSPYGKYLYQTGDGHVWISAGDGVIEYDGRTFHPYTPGQGLLKGGGQMVEDSTGNLWLGWPNGLMRLDRRGFTTYGLADGFKNLAILAINESRDGKLYVVCDDFFLSRFVDKGFETLRAALPHDAKAVWTSNAVYQDRAGEWWVLTNEKLYRFAASESFDALAGQRPLAVYTTRDGLKGDQIFHVFEDSKGDLWVSVRGANTSQIGLSRWDRATEKFYTFSEAENFPSGKSASSFAEDRNGNLWFGFYEGGLARYVDGRFTEFTVADGLPDGVVTALHIDRQGRLWAATSLGGLSRVDDTTAPHPPFATYTTDNGLASNNARSLAEDLSGNIYAGTARGVDKLSPDATRIRHYSVKDGLAGDFVNVAFRDRSGALWFGTPNGLSRLVPQAENGATPPVVRFGALRVAGESRPLPKLGSTDVSDLELSPAQNNVQIDYFGIDFSAGEALRYQYMLEGADKNWSAPTEQHTVNYANLAPGSYRFLVRAVGTDGAPGARPATVSFRALPPVWRRWWFVALIVLLAASVIYALIRRRLAQLKALRESENRFRTLAETASDAIITIDEASRIIFVNATAERVFGYTTAEMLGANLTMMMPEYLRHVHEAGLARYITTGRKHIAWEAVELPGLHKSGREIPLELSFGEFTKNGQRFFTGIARDITERKRAAEALRRAREERLRELERVRTRIATDLHDDIGASLTQIVVLSEVARRQAGEGNGHSSESLTKITNVSNELVEAMSDIVWAINPKKDHLNDLVQRMRRFASDIFSACGIKLTLRSTGADGNVQLGANVRRELFLIFKESVNNIARHSGCTDAAVEFYSEGDHLVLKLSDNGKGFEPALINADDGLRKGGNGLSSMRRRAHELGGTFEISSTPGQGASTILRVPLGQQSSPEENAHPNGR